MFIIYFGHECHFVGILIEFKRKLKAKYVSLQLKFKMNDRYWNLTRLNALNAVNVVLDIKAHVFAPVSLQWYFGSKYNVDDW